MTILASNFTDKFSADGTIEKLQNYVKLWVFFHISRTVKARNLKVGMHIDHEGHYNEQNVKLCSRSRGQRLR